MKIPSWFRGRVRLNEVVYLSWGRVSRTGIQVSWKLFAAKAGSESPNGNLLQTILYKSTRLL